MIFKAIKDKNKKRGASDSVANLLALENLADVLSGTLW